MNAHPIESILTWLRAGYPAGIPRQDYVALFAVLHRRLTENEVRTIAEELSSVGGPALEDGTISNSEIEHLIAKVTLEVPGDDDVARVASRLALGGWPLADAPTVPAVQSI